MAKESKTKSLGQTPSLVEKKLDALRKNKSRTKAKLAASDLRYVPDKRR